MRLTVSNFRTIDCIDLELEGLVHIDGKNGAGKTNLIQALIKAHAGFVPDGLKSNVPVSEYGAYAISVVADGYEIHDHCLEGFSGSISNAILDRSGGRKGENREEFDKFLGLSDLDLGSKRQLVLQKLYWTPESKSVLELKDAEQTRVLLSLFGIYKLQDALNLAKDQKKALETGIEVLSNQISALSIIDTRSVSRIESEIATLDEFLKGKTDPVVAASYKSHIDNKQLKIKQLKTKFNLEINGIDSKISELEKEIKSKPDVDEEYLKDKQDELQHLIGRLNGELDGLKLQITAEELYCPVCGTELMYLDNTLAKLDVRKISMEISNKELELSKLERSLVSVRASLETLSNIRELDFLRELLANKYTLSQLRITELQGEIDSLNDDIQVSEVFKKDFDRLKELRIELAVAKRNNELATLKIKQEAQLQVLKQELEIIKFLCSKTGFKAIMSWAVSQSAHNLADEINHVLLEIGAKSELAFQPKIDEEHNVRGITISVSNNNRQTELYGLNNSEKRFLSYAAMFAERKVYPHPLDRLGLLLIDDMSLSDIDLERRQMLASFIKKQSEETVIVIASCYEEIGNLFNPDLTYKLRNVNGKSVIA